MAAVGQNIGLPRAEPYVAGDHLEIMVTVSNLDLTGADIRWAVFPWPEGPKFGQASRTAAIEKSLGNGITITNAAGGEFRIAIEPSDTSELSGFYVHEAQVTVNGQTYTVMTASKCFFQITPQWIV
jgi:hypothetical protein